MLNSTKQTSFNQNPGRRESGDAVALALQALVWTLSEPARADRLLAVTGLEAAELRAGADSPVILAALLSFLESHEPDLIACAAALKVRPESLVGAREALER